MAGFALLAFPFVLLGFVLLMARVEDPLRNIPTDRDIERFLDTATPAEMDTFVTEGTDRGLARLRARLAGRRRRRGVKRAD